MMHKKISIIAALSDNGVIGGNNQLLWHISNDLKRFKKMTTGHTVVMGKNTFLSLPVKPLPNRTNIVLSRKGFPESDQCTVVHSVEEALKLMDTEYENFVIGGGEIYRAFLPYSQKMYLTRVHKHFDGDTLFPDFSEAEWKLEHDELIVDDPQNDFAYTFQLFVRK
ncbi:MAG: dihydrofolate reductase [Bacteroidales bacterium]|nr:dihydrofolate reductase [Bacteroidales bacterium]